MSNSALAVVTRISRAIQTQLVKLDSIRPLLATPELKPHVDTAMQRGSEAVEELQFIRNALRKRK